MTRGELTSTNGTVVWDGLGTLRIRYDATRSGFHPLAGAVRARLGERVLPVEALRSVEVTGTGARLVLREGADPLQSVTRLIDVYDFPGVDLDLAGDIARDVAQVLVRRDVPATAATAWLVAPPGAPDQFEGHDATLVVANGRLTFTYRRSAGRKKKALGDLWSVPLDEIVDVEWMPEQGRLGARGFLRIATAATPDVRPKPRHDPATMVSRRHTDVDVLFFATRLLTRIRP
ncbi:DUF4429 domain-containing protein [Kribbella sp. NPDC003557]|uniref:DUF4429 domain-containing protein n=1 Tax=Kribbella sp. NPDC003557 TaxID=3154449 RepID=UPI0033B27A8F